VHGQQILSNPILTLNSRGSASGGLDCRQEECDQNTDNGDNDQ
jgi:hypothetical protein